MPTNGFSIEFRPLLELLLTARRRTWESAGEQTLDLIRVPTPNRSDTMIPPIFQAHPLMWMDDPFRTTQETLVSDASPVAVFPPFWKPCLKTSGTCPVEVGGLSWRA